MTIPSFFSPAWAGAVRDAVDRGPDERTRAAKLADYWNWVDNARRDYSGTWALGVRDLPAGGGLPAYLVLTWELGRCVDGRIAGPGGAPAVPPAASPYVLAGDYADWRRLLGGYDAGRLVMYRRIVLEDGPLLRFFRIIYFFVESLGCLARVPARFVDQPPISPSLA